MGAAERVDRKERACVYVWGEVEGQGLGDCWSLGAYGPPTRGKGLFSMQHMPSLSQAGHLPHISGLLRRNVSDCSKHVQLLFFFIQL